MTESLIALFGAAFAVSAVLSRVVSACAARLGVLDRPGEARKIHARPMPLLGGLAIYATIAGFVVYLLMTSTALTSGEITTIHYVGFLVGGLILMIGGYLDDRYRLPPRLSIIAPVLAAVAAVAFGIQVEKLTNPFGGVIYLAAWQSDILVFVWLLVVMFTTKFLDGLDGLATGVSAIGTLMVMLLALTVAYFQPDVAVLSAVALGALLGFLVWNFNPAQIFLGEGGSTFVGYLLGTLAVISGGKLATALLVLAIPLLDVIWVIARRIAHGGFAAATKGDKKHLHHRLLDLGWSQRRIVLAYYALAAAFGVLTLFLQSREKLFALGALTLAMVIAAAALVVTERHRTH